MNKQVKVRTSERERERERERELRKGKQNKGRIPKWVKISSPSLPASHLIMKSSSENCVFLSSPLLFFSLHLNRIKSTKSEKVRDEKEREQGESMSEHWLSEHKREAREWIEEQAALNHRENEPMKEKGIGRERRKEEGGGRTDELDEE